MDRLTKEQIETIRQHWCDVPIKLKDHPAVKTYNLLCDMALQSLSLESVRSEALAEWVESVRLTIRGIDLQAERITRREQTTFRDGENQAPDEDEDFDDVVIGYKLNTGLWHHLLGLLASFPSALRSPARVAERPCTWCDPSFGCFNLSVPCQKAVHSTELRK